MLIFFFLLSLAILVYTIYKFTFDIFDARKPQRHYISTSIFCGAVYFAYTYYFSFMFEAIATLFFLAAYFFVIRYVYIGKNLTSLFRAYTLLINLLSIRLILIPLLAMHNEMSILDYVADRHNRFFITTLSLFFLGIYFIVLRLLLSRASLAHVKKDDKQYMFSLVLLSILLLFDIFVINRLFFMDIEDSNLLYISIITGVFSLAVYAFTFYFDYTFYVLRGHRDKYKSLSLAIIHERENVRKLKKEANTDSFTGLSVRDVAYTRVEHFLDDDEPFYIIFVDMNELKIVNDSYGHNEGDFYILEVVKQLKDHFPQDTIGKLGGDEFLIVGKLDTEANLREKIEKCEQEIIAISQKNAKEYNTSISYGLLIINSHAEFDDADTAIALADERMYEHKKALKKERKTVAPHLVHNA